MNVVLGAVGIAIVILGLAFIIAAFIPPRQRKPEVHGVPHRDYAGKVVDPSRTLLGRDLESVYVKVRTDDKATLRLICEDGSFVEFGLTAVLVDVVEAVPPRWSS